MDQDDPEKRIAELERQLAEQKRIAELKRQLAEAKAAAAQAGVPHFTQPPTPGPPPPPSAPQSGPAMRWKGLGLG
jgi:endonuclease/exonuclease/phosphatase (EEP) superfamily protein YafD